MSTPPDSTRPFPFLQLPLEVRCIIYGLVYTPPNYQVDLINFPPPDIAPLLLSRQITPEALPFYELTRRRGHWFNQAYWHDTAFYVDAHTDIVAGILRLSQSMNILRLSTINRVDLRSSCSAAVFSFYYGVWRCTGTCCSEVRPPLQHYAANSHLQPLVVLPSRFPPAGMIDYSLVRMDYGLNFDLPRNIPGGWPGPVADRLRVAELASHGSINTTVARLATRSLWTGLTFRELTGMWIWYNTVTQSECLAMA